MRTGTFPEGKAAPQRPAAGPEPVLVVPSAAFRQSFLEAAAELLADNPDTYLGEARIVPDGFDSYLAGLLAHESGRDLQPGYVPATTRWLVAGDRWLGRVELRHGLTEGLREWGGHLGYVLRPAERGRGYGNLLMRYGKDLARERGLDRVLLTCYASNEASRAVIERAGGVLEDESPSPEGRLRRRYWVSA